MPSYNFKVCFFESLIYVQLSHLYTLLKTLQNLDFAILPEEYHYLIINNNKIRFSTIIFELNSLISAVYDGDVLTLQNVVKMKELVLQMNENYTKGRRYIRFIVSKL